jgi:hypothetical protein
MPDQRQIELSASTMAPPQTGGHPMGPPGNSTTDVILDITLYQFAIPPRCSLKYLGELVSMSLQWPRQLHIL